MGDQQQPPQLALPDGVSWEPDRMGHLLIDAPPVPGGTTAAAAAAAAAAACQAGWAVVFLAGATAAPTVPFGVDPRAIDLRVDLVDRVHAELRRRRGDRTHTATPLLLILDDTVVANLPRWAAAVPLHQLTEIARVGRAYRVLLALQMTDTPRRYQAIPGTLRANLTTRLTADGASWPWLNTASQPGAAPPRGRR
jgi:hypothetical protein